VGRRLWDSWLGARTFYQDPLYPYFLAVLYAPFGRHVGLVFLVQALLGLGSIVLLWAVARRLADDTVALVAGLLAALYGPLVLYENVLLRTALINVTGLAVLYASMRAIAAPSLRRFVGVGVLGALAGLTTSSGWTFPLALLGLSPLALRADRVMARRAVAGLVAGMLLGLAPVVARNLAVGVAPFSLASSGAITFVNHNAADYDPMGGTAMSAHADEIMGRTGGKTVPAIRATIETHESVAAWLRLLGRKFLAVWHWYEIPNNESYDYLLLHAPMLRAVGIGFGLAAPLALVGLFLAFRRSWDYALVVTYLGCCLVSLVILYTLGRLRLQLAVALLPFAAYTLVALVRDLAAGRMKRAGAALAAAAVLTVAIGRPLGSRTPIRLQDYGVGNEIAVKLTRLRLAEGDTWGALHTAERQLETEPEELRTLEPRGERSILSRLGASLAGSFAPVHEAYAEALDQLGNHRGAKDEQQRALILQAVADQHARRGEPTP
jgi:4-amino-4-deoxy-L-arabinose transferase-like glycosyltransferase